MAEKRFDFLKDLVATVPDVQGDEDLVETPRSSASNTAFVFPSTSAAASSAVRDPEEVSYAPEQPHYDDDPHPQPNDEEDQKPYHGDPVHMGILSSFT